MNLTLSIKKNCRFLLVCDKNLNFVHTVTTDI